MDGIYHGKPYQHLYFMDELGGTRVPDFWTPPICAMVRKVGFEHEGFSGI